MKFNVSSKQLLTRLNAASKVISNKNAYAILDNFLFELESERLVITASDMETRMTTSIDVPGAEGSGKFAIDVKRLLSLLKEFPDTGMTFEFNETTFEVIITYLSGKFVAMSFDGDEYPLKAPSATEPFTFTLAEKDVYDGLQHCLFAVGTDEMHPQFMGVYWDIYPDNITFVASDAHKLVRYRKTQVTPNSERNFIMPAKPAQILANILDKNSKNPVSITIEETSATFETADYTLTCRFINGRYPKYNSVIPESNPYTVSVDRQTLLNALRRVSVFAAVGGLIKLNIRPTQLLLTTQDLDHATSAEESVPCEYDGEEEMTMGFKNADIIDVLNNLNSETVSIKLLDPTRAGLFLPSEQTEGEDLLVLQMPMMI